MSEGALLDRDFREILVETCRSESDDVGVGWGKDWGKRSRSDWLASSPVHRAREQDEFLEVGRGLTGQGPVQLPLYLREVHLAPGVCQLALRHPRDVYAPTSTRLPLRAMAISDPSCVPRIDYRVFTSSPSATWSSISKRRSRKALRIIDKLCLASSRPPLVAFFARSFAVHDPIPARAYADASGSVLAGRRPRRFRRR